METRIQGALKSSEVIKSAIWNGMMSKNRQVIREIVDSIGTQEGFDFINIYDANHVLHYSSNPEFKALIGTKGPQNIPTSHLLGNLDKDKTTRYELLEGTNLLTVVNPLINTKNCSTAECHAHPPSHEVLGALEVKLQLRGLHSTIRENAKNVVLFAAFLFLLLSTIIGLAVIYLISRPVDRLRAKAEKIARGDYVPVEEVSGSDSISELSRTLDQMSLQISERQNEIDQRRRIYKELFEKVPCYLVAVDSNFHIVQANQTFVSEFGNPENQYCYKAFKDSNFKCHNCQVDKTFQDGFAHRANDVWKFAGSDDETHVIIYTTPIMDQNNRITQVLEMAVDITRMVKLQEEVKKKEKQFRDIFENIPCYLTVVDPSFRIGFYNKMFHDDFGHRWGETCYSAYKNRSEKCENCPVERTFKDGQSHYSEEIWNLEGEEKHIIVRTSPLYDDNGSIMAVMEMCTNVTELKMLENRLAVLGETIAGTSHAIKNILSGLEGGVYIVDSGLKSDKSDRIKTGWTIVKKNVNLVSELVKDILYASKERSPEYKRVDPGEILNNVAELFEQKSQNEGIKLIRDFDGQLGTGMLDPGGLHMVASNLISNAISACTQNPTADCTQIVLSARIEDSKLVVEVTDTGKGMSDEVKKNLFKKFYSTKGAKGTGLGLLVSKKIVEENGGTIDFESEVGMGTKFIVQLPFNREVPGGKSAE